MMKMTDSVPLHSIKVTAKCAMATASQSRCCSMFSDVCSELQADCEVDVCIMATVNGVGNSSSIEGHVDSTLTAAIDELCAIPGVEDAFSESVLLEFEHVGCWRDDVENRAINYTKQNMESLAECIDHCYDNDFVFAAVINATRVFRCYCTDDQAAFEVLTHNQTMYILGLYSDIQNRHCIQSANL